MKTWMTAAALAIAAMAAGAEAQTPPAAAPGRVATRAEAIADADRRFAAMDTNRDGKLSADERRAWREQRRAGRGAGKRNAEQTQATFREQALRRFDRIDTNRDGTIDAREREAARLLMRARRAGHDRGTPPADPAGPTG